MRHLQARVERARQSYNEKLVRANAEYYAALERALEVAKAEGAAPAEAQADAAPSTATSVA
jgi:hypothetical protein